MKLKNYFFPPADLFDSLSYRDQKKVSALVTGDLCCCLMFVLFALLLTIVVRKAVLGILILLMSAFFIFSLLFVKKGKLTAASYVATLGLALATYGVGFFTSRVTDPAVCYRTICFCIAVSCLNYDISMKKGQLIILYVSSFVLLFLSTFILYRAEFLMNMKDWINTLAINVVAVITANSVLLLSFSHNETIVAHSEKEHETVLESLNTITNVLGQVKESLNVGQRLNSAADTATSSVDSINEVYQVLIRDTENLDVQSVNIKNSSAIVEQQTQLMSSSISDQNNSLEEISAAITQISANISNINTIAEKRRTGMAEITGLLDSQNQLIKKIIDDFIKVEESSNRIAEFVKTVEKISSQTNLLAMNASIEAAHSGEHGKGFGVIAQEIRKLSEETAVNAKNISDTLMGNSEVVRETAESVNLFADANKKTETEIRENFNSIEEILHGITEMDIGTREITDSVNKVVNVANDNSKIIEEVVTQISNQNDGINNINAATSSLKERVTSISEMLPLIVHAMEDVQSSAKENDEVSSRIADILK